VGGTVSEIDIDVHHHAGFKEDQRFLEEAVRLVGAFVDNPRLNDSVSKPEAV
jgi:hypothetical protein